MRLAAALVALALAGAAAAKPPAAVTEAVRSRAASADFRGTLLIGEADGSHTVLTLGQPPLAADAIWRWASITKQLTAVLAMQQVAAGKMDLEAPVSRYWPEWKAPNAGKIRIRDLLLHNSGLPQPDESAADKDGVPAFYRSAAAAPAVAAAGFCAGPPKAAPPAEFDYNNCDALVLAEVLRKVTGKDFETLLAERLTGPLGMTRTGVFGLGPRTPHVGPTGAFSKEDALLNMGVYGASGGAYGPVEDLWRFDHALMAGKLLPAAAMETMWQSSRDNGYHGFFQWIYEAPLKGCAKPVRIVERQGLIGGIELRNFILPESGRALLVFTHHRPGNYGDPWEGKGLSFDMLSTLACRT